ncbi:MAG: hypothetical protein FWH34_04850 [Desulfovibrionaceae bacterium]|nr:hypothetical protein [Desulfovibrionaceae bacterium]
MRLRTCILSLSALFALVYPLALWQKQRIFSSIPIMESLAYWFWIAEPLLIALFLFASAAAIRQKILQYVCIIAASCFLALFTAETHLRSKSADFFSLFQSHESVYVKSGITSHLDEKDSTGPDPLLGYGPNPMGKMRLAARRAKGDELIYDVLYSRDAEGRRVTPDRGDKADTAILLFGCSFTVGAGLNDQETFAWQLGEMLGEKFQVFNYGYSGYGSHQMLALIESGRLDALMGRYTQKYALYLTIPKHEQRCVGLDNWSRFAPRYILENGALIHAGTLRDSEYRLFAHSLLYHRLYDWVYALENPAFLQWLTARPVDTHVAIIAKSMHELAARYQADFLTVLWPGYLRIEPYLRRLEPKLRDKGVRTLSLTGVMPDYTREKYRIKGDGHPNALAATRIAEALFEYILENTQTGAKQP